MKVGFISIYSAPYRDEILTAFQAKYADIELIVFSLGNKHIDHPEWKYDSGIAEIDFRKHQWSILLNEKVDALVVCGDRQTLLTAILYSLLYKKRIIFMADTVCETGTIPVLYLKYALKVLLSKRFFSVWCPGKRSKLYWEKFIRHDRIFEGCYTFDNKKIFDKISSIRSEDVMFEKNRLWGENSSFIFLFVGQLNPKRRIGNLLLAFQNMNKKTNKQAGCLVIGEGEEERIVHEYEKTNPFIKHIRSVNFEKLHSFYALADAYVHPGREPYSLAVYEAAIAGVPIIAGLEVGAVHDCLRNGKNGYIIEPNSIDSLEKAMMKVLNNEIDRDECKKVSEYLVNHRSTDWASEQLYRAISGMDRELV